MVVMEDSQIFQAIDSAAKNGKFGDNLKLVEVIPSDVHGEDHFSSDVIFAGVKLQNSSTVKTVNVVIKLQQKDVYYRQIMNTSEQFYNEALVYNEIFPLIDRDEILKKVFCKLIYARATLDEHLYEEDIVVLEDLRQYGYMLTKDKIVLDFDHCTLALKNLAKFHALSYSNKQDNICEFFKVINKLREMKYQVYKREDTNRFLRVAVERGTLLLEKEGQYKNILEKLRKKLEDPFTMMKTFCQPEEPLAVLCHGDFCRNNMVFQYNSNGKPVDVRFYDLAMARYASPAIDLVFFLLMNTSTELRMNCWDDLLKVYHDSLSTAVRAECNVPSLDAIRQEVSSKVLYGYTICSFFIPMMIDVKKDRLRDHASKTPEEMEAFIRARGGEKATKLVTDIVRDLIRLDCL